MTEILPCGRDALDVVDDAREGRSDEHEQSCPYCRAVMDTASTSFRGAGELRDSERNLRVPDSLLPSVMRTVWSDVRRSAMLPADVPEGPTFVARHVVSALIETALRPLPGLRLRTCAVEPAQVEDQAEDQHTDAGRPVPALLLTASGAYGFSLAQIAEDARALVGQALARNLGWPDCRVDVHFSDLFDSESDEGRHGGD